MDTLSLTYRLDWHDVALAPSWLSPRLADKAAPLSAMSAPL